jgi:hypothetical protein
MYSSLFVGGLLLSLFGCDFFFLCFLGLLCHEFGCEFLLLSDVVVFKKIEEVAVLWLLKSLEQTSFS